MKVRTRRFIRTGAVALALLLAGCGGGGEEEEPPSAEETTPTTDPALTAPPTMTAEEKAEEELLGTFEALIADRDEFYSNASDYGGEDGWNVTLVGQWPVEDEAELDLANWTGAWRSSEIEQAGDTFIATHDVGSINLNVTESGVHEASSEACLDMTNLEYRTYDGQPADPPSTPSQHQIWTMSWTYIPNSTTEPANDEAGWYVQAIDLSFDEPC